MLPTHEQRTYRALAVDNSNCDSYTEAAVKAVRQAMDYTGREGSWITARRKDDDDLVYLFLVQSMGGRIVIHDYRRGPAFDSIRRALRVELERLVRDKQITGYVIWKLSAEGSR